MGAGASTIEAGRGASEDELLVVAQGLDEESRKRVLKALESSTARGYSKDAPPAPAAPAAGDVPDLVIPYSEDWEDTIEALLMSHAEMTGACATTHDCHVFSAQGREIPAPDLITQDAFPLTARFTKLEGGGGHAAFEMLTVMSEFFAKKKAEMSAAMNEESTSAPFLRQFYQKIYAFTQENMLDMELLMQMAFDPQAQAAQQQKHLDFFNNTCKPLLEQSFKKHDTDGTNTLCKEEAAIFFKNVTAEQSEFCKAMAMMGVEAAVMQGLQMMIGMVGSMTTDKEAKEATDVMKKQVNDSIDLVKAEMEKLKTNYEANAETLNAEAFKVVDTSGDGTLQLEEFLAAFQPESEKNAAFVAALGLAPATPSPPPPAEGEDGECCVM